MADIRSEYTAVLQELAALQSHVSQLRGQIQAQGQEYRDFEKLFIKGNLATNVESCATGLTQVTQTLQQSMDSEIKKLPLMADYAVLCKQRDRLRSSGVHLTALLKKAGARGTEPISRKLLQSDVAAEIAAYNQKVTRLSQSATNPNAFRQAFTLQKKAVPVEVDSGAGAAVVGRVKKGSIIEFGTYPQTAAGNDKTPIEWIVLDFIDGKALVISKYGLDAKPYNTQQTDITW